MNIFQNEIIETINKYSNLSLELRLQILINITNQINASLRQQELLNQIKILQNQKNNKNLQVIKGETTTQKIDDNTEVIHMTFPINKQSSSQIVEK